MRDRVRGSLLFLVTLLAAASSLQAVERRAFLTSIVGTGDLSTWPGATGAGALQRADAICRARAVAAGLDNSSTFRAWLSTGGTDAYCHVQGLSGKKADSCDSGTLPGGGPWYNTGDSPVRPFLPALDELTDNSAPYGPAQFDEFGEPVDDLVANDRVWTGTKVDGTVWDAFHCSNWGSAEAALSAGSGLGHGSGSHWTGRGTYGCSGVARLLCLEPGASDPVNLRWFPGVLAFVTSAFGSGDLSSWPQAEGATGLAAGDAICRNVAEAASLPQPDSFVAWLSNGSVDAIDRLTTDGPFRRVDRLQLAGSAAGLTDGVLGNTLHVTEHGERLYTTSFAWTGTRTDGTVDAAHCTNWDSADAGVEGGHGIVVNAASSWTDDSTYAKTCNVLHRLYCFANVLTVFWDGFELTGDSSRWSQTVP